MITPKAHIYRQLGVVALLEPAASRFHDAGLFVGEVDLVFIPCAFLRGNRAFASRCLAGVRCFGLALGQLGLVLGLFLLKTLTRTFFNLSFGLPDGTETVFTAGDLVGQVEACRYLLVVRFCGQREELLDFSLQLLFELLDVAVTQRAVPGCVGVDFGAVQRDVAQLEHAHRAGDEQHLNHESFDLRQEPFAESVQGVVVGVQVRRNVQERHGIIGGGFQFAAGEYAGRIAIGQDGVVTT